MAAAAEVAAVEVVVMARCRAQRRRLPPRRHPSRTFALFVLNPCGSIVCLPAIIACVTSVRCACVHCGSGETARFARQKLLASFSHRMIPSLMALLRPMSCRTSTRNSPSTSRPSRTTTILSCFSASSAPNPTARRCALAGQTSRATPSASTRVCCVTCASSTRRFLRTMAILPRLSHAGAALSQGTLPVSRTPMPGKEICRV